MLDYYDSIVVLVGQMDYEQVYTHYLCIILDPHQDKFIVYDYFVVSFASFTQKMQINVVSIVIVLA